MCLWSVAIRGFPKVWIFGFLDFWFLEMSLRTFWIFGFLDFWIIGFLDFWIFGFLELWIFGFLDFWIFGFLDYWTKSEWNRWEVLHFPKKSVNCRRVWHVMVTPLSVWTYFFGQMSHLSTFEPTFFENSQMSLRFQWFLFQKSKNPKI